MQGWTNDYPNGYTGSASSNYRSRIQSQRCGGLLRNTLLSMRSKQPPNHYGYWAGVLFKTTVTCERFIFCAGMLDQEGIGNLSNGIMLLNSKSRGRELMGAVEWVSQFVEGPQSSVISLFTRVWPNQNPHQIGNRHKAPKRNDDALLLLWYIRPCCWTRIDYS